MLVPGENTQVAETPQRRVPVSSGRRPAQRGRCEGRGTLDMPSAYHTFSTRSSTPGTAQKRHFPTWFREVRPARAGLAVMIFLAGLSACGTNEKPGPVGLLFAPDFRGGVVTDE